MQKKPFSLGKMMLASVGTIAFIILASWIWRPPETLVPSDLVGEWHTSNANYWDRSFEIAPVSVSFGTGGGTVTTGFIKKVRAVQQGARTLYTISYTTDETVNKVSFYYETVKGKVIRFRNQEGIAWTKD
jgi:hypothetical protein